MPCAAVRGARYHHGVHARWILGLLALAGCDRVFGVDRPPVDAAPEIDAAIDAPPDGPCPTMTAQVVHDAVLDAKIPTQFSSTNTVLTLEYASSSGLQTHGIFKFDVAGLPRPTGIEVVLPHATHSDACGGSNCQFACATLERAGAYGVHAMRSDWDEQEGANRGATWRCRRGTTDTCTADAWNVEGALGQLDRGPELASFAMTPGQGASAYITAEEDVDDAWGWIQGDRLSFQVVPRVDSGKFVIRSSEATCDPMEPRPHLVLSYCPP